MAHFQGCLEWWNDRIETDAAWCLSAADIVQSGYNLDARNPRGQKVEILLKPAELVSRLLSVEDDIGKHVREIKRIIEAGL